MSPIDVIYSEAMRSKIAAKLTILAGMILLSAILGCQTTSPAVVPADSGVAPEVSVPAEQGTSQIIEKLGVEVIAVRTTAAGSMLDFRFRVLDREKAMPLFLKEIKPFLIDEASEKSLVVPVPGKGGPMRPTSRDPREGIVYFMLFGNPGKFVKPGNSVTIVVGEHRIAHLIVE